MTAGGQTTQAQAQQTDTGLAVATATVLVSATTVPAAQAALARRYLAAGISRQALGGSLTVVMGYPPDVLGAMGPATARVIRLNTMRRAQFAVAAARRINADVISARSRNGSILEAVRSGIARERGYYGQHLVATWNRADAAARTDAAVGQYGLLLGWNAVHDRITSAECRAADGANFRADMMPLIGYPGMVHPHCFPAGTKAVSPSVMLATSRWYRGDFIEIFTMDGNWLTVTPNHPVLTTEGWIPACLVRKGTNMIRALDPSATAALGDPYENHVEALIEDVLSPGRSTIPVATATVPVSSEDFHGDGTDHQVAVVRADSELMHRLQVGEPGGVQRLQRAVRGPSVLRGSDPGPVLGRLLTPADGFMGRLGIAGILLASAPAHHQLVGAGHVAPGDAVPDQEPGEGISAYLSGFRERLDGLASQIAIDPVTRIFRTPGGTHVYNLQTTSGWYIANGFIVHNCRCVPGPPRPGARMLPSALRAVA